MANKNKKTGNTSFSEKAPITLEDHPFYGLVLDEEQIAFRDAIYNPEKLVVLCNAKAGTGKTTVALGVANIMVQYGLYDGIIYIMSPTMEQKQGYLPGSQEEKNAPYMEPLIEALYTLNLDPDHVLKSDSNVQGLKDGSAYIDFKVNTYLRGCNFENKVVICDEFQNNYFDEAKKVLTRIHDSCKTIIIGEISQCDLLKHQDRSGFRPYLEAFRKANDPRCEICELTHNHRGWFSSFCDDVTM